MQQQKPLEGAQLVIMTIALSLATFMQVLDSTIANVAIPTIAGNLGSSLSQGTWVITSFGVANAISIPLTGWLAKRVGEVKLFLWSTIAFAIASWACGVSSSLIFESGSQQIFSLSGLEFDLVKFSKRPSNAVLCEACPDQHPCSSTFPLSLTPDTVI